MPWTTEHEWIFSRQNWQPTFIDNQPRIRYIWYNFCNYMSFSLLYYWWARCVQFAYEKHRFEARSYSKRVFRATYQIHRQIFNQPLFLFLGGAAPPQGQVLPPALRGSRPHFPALGEKGGKTIPGKKKERVVVYPSRADFLSKEKNLFWSTRRRRKWHRRKEEEGGTTCIYWIGN